MKIFTLVFLVLSLNAFAGDLTLKDFGWNLTDISRKGVTKEQLFTEMDRNFIKLGSSICSNRALMWAKQFKDDHNLDTGKIFLFYTKKEDAQTFKTWWYHVAPVVNEKSSLWVLDAGFPYMVKQPLSVPEWLQKFSNKPACREIKGHETDLIEIIFREQTFPHRTAYGYHECYYIVAPHTIWTPEVLAKTLLGKDAQGRPVRVSREELDANELYQSCIEATTTKIGYALGKNKKECKEYAGIRD